MQYKSELVQDRYSDLPAILSRAGSWIFGIPKFHLVLPFRAEQQQMQCDGSVPQGVSTP